MAIRDRWNRMLRRSAGSSSSSEGHSDDGHTSPTTSTAAAAAAARTTTARATRTARTPTAATPTTPTPRPTPTRTITAPTPAGAGASKSPRRPPINKMASWRSQNGHPNPHRDHASPPNTGGGGGGGGARPALRHRPLSFFGKPHPRDRVPTEQNLRYQESLGNFRWEFGRSRPSSRGSLDSYDVSPCHSRAGSLDFGEGGGRGAFCG